MSKLKALAIQCDTGLLDDPYAWSSDCQNLASLQADIVAMIEQYDFFEEQ